MFYDILVMLAETLGGLLVVWGYEVMKFQKVFYPYSLSCVGVFVLLSGDMSIY